MKNLWNVPLVILALGAGCGGRPNDPLDSNADDQSASAGTLKREIGGLLDRKGEPATSLNGSLSGWVVNVGWSQLQPAQGAPIVHPNPIDDALAALPNHPGMHLKIRFEQTSSGNGALDPPLWARNLGGAPVQLVDPNSGASGSVGRFWTPEFGAAYAEFQRALAAAYDGNPGIRDVTIARCTTIYSEPMVRAIGSSQNVSALLAAGYTLAADQQCQREQIAAHAVWARTHSSLALNPYQVINGDGSTGIDETFTEATMAYCRATLGSRCTLENNSVRQSSLGPDYSRMYAAINALGPTIHYQTATPARVGDLATVIEWAIGQGANAVELPSGYSTLLTLTQMQTYNTELRINPR